VEGDRASAGTADGSSRRPEAMDLILVTFAQRDRGPWVEASGAGWPSAIAAVKDFRVESPRMRVSPPDVYTGPLD